MTRVAILIALACACGDNVSRTPPDAQIAPDHDAAIPLAFVTGPTLVVNPSGVAPLAGQLSLATNRPTRVQIAIADVNRMFTIDPPGLAADHTVPVLGFRPNNAHQVTITVTDEHGESLVAPAIDVTTAPLPTSFPVISVLPTMPAMSEPGVTLIGIRNFIFTVEADGNINWFVDVGLPAVDIRRIANGNILYSTRDMTGAVEIDMLGNVVRRWHAANTSSGAPGSVAVPIDTMHHELALLADGNFLTMSSEKRSYANYPTSETDPTPQSEPQDIVGDVIVFFAADGTVVRTWPLLDILDPYRIGYGSFGTFWNIFYPGALDWSHGNAVTPDPSGGYLISLRHQDAVIKVSDEGELVWILGTHDNWSSAFAPYLLTPVGTPFAWPFHQHAPRVLANGNILVFDNGNFRVSPPAAIPPSQYSRAVEYRVDPTTMQVEQVWEFDHGKTVFANATGDVDIGPATGNVIVTFGSARRIVEVTHTTPPAIVFQLFVNDTLYRAERLPSLYP